MCVISFSDLFEKIDEYLIKFFTPELLFLHKYLIGQLSKYFRESPVAPSWDVLGRHVGETSVRVLFLFFFCFWRHTHYA